VQIILYVFEFFLMIVHAHTHSYIHTEPIYFRFQHDFIENIYLRSSPHPLSNKGLRTYKYIHLYVYNYVLQFLTVLCL